MYKTVEFNIFEEALEDLVYKNDRSEAKRENKYETVPEKNISEKTTFELCLTKISERLRARSARK